MEGPGNPSQVEAFVLGSCNKASLFSSVLSEREGTKEGAMQVLCE